MSWRVVYRSAILHKGKWLPKVAYIRDEKPAILEGDPRCPYNTRDEAFQHTPDLVAYLREKFHEVETPPLAAK